MATDLLTLRLLPEHAGHTVPPTLVPLDVADRDALAEAYLAAYPPQVGAADLAAAREEMDESFTGGYGRLRPDASWSATLQGRVVGAVMVVERSVWDPDVTGPFVIDLFLDPAARGHALGRALLQAAVTSCARAGDRTLTLRFGEGTSDAAHRLYAGLGFVPWTPPA